MKNRTVSLADIQVTAGTISSTSAALNASKPSPLKATKISYHAFFAACNSFSFLPTCL